MPPYRRVGDIPRKRHTLHRVDGKVAAEELMGEEGFSAASSLLYHRHSPSALRSIESLEAPEPSFTANSPLQPHHLRTGELGPGASPDPVLGRRYLLGNDRSRSRSRPRSSHRRCTATRRATSSCTSRAARRCSSRVFGRMAVREGDYVGRPEQHDAPVVARRAGRALGHRGAGPRRPPPQVPHRARPAARGCAVQRARSPRARRRPARRRGRRRRRCSCARAAV